MDNTCTICQRNVIRADYIKGFLMLLLTKRNGAIIKRLILLKLQLPALVAL